MSTNLSSRRRHTRYIGDWSSDVCSSDLCQPRQRAKEFVKFLHQLEKEVPPDQEVHLVMDNYSTHKSEVVQRWLQPKKRRRFHFHFTSTRSEERRVGKECR